MLEGRRMTAAAAVVIVVAMLGCGGGAKDKDSTPTASDAAPAAQDRENPAPAASPSGAEQAANPAQPQDQFDPATAAGAVKGVPAPTNSGQIEAVANFFAELPGFDLAPLGEQGKAKFLHRVNSEHCTCGCKTDTLAFCLVNDPKCQKVHAAVQAVYDEVKSGK